MAKVADAVAREHLERNLGLVCQSLHHRSGAVFYSGVAAFRGRYPIYLLGYNPGGDAKKRAKETIGESIRTSKRRTDALWCAYRDEAWKDWAPGCERMQCRVTTLLWKLNLDIRQIPASNLIFERSVDSKKLRQPRYLEERCWPVHAGVIKDLEIKLVLCLGKETARRVMDRTNGGSGFQECPIGRWPKRGARARAAAFSRSEDFVVVQLPHASRSEWTWQKKDPSDWLKSVLQYYKIQ